MPATVPSRRTTRVLVAALVATLAAAGLPARATTGPPDVAPTTTPGATVALEPAVVRAVDGRAELDVVVGVDAPADVVVEPRLAVPVVARDGTVTPGSEAAPGTVSTGTRLGPGERLRVVATGLTTPALVVAAVRPADQPDAADDTTTVAALVLPGSPSEAPRVTLEQGDGATRAVVDATTPLLVTVTVAGRERTTFPDRLVLPEQPVELMVAPARWPLPTEVAVTDEAGRTVRASTGTAPLALTATALVVLTALLVLAGRRRRDRVRRD